MDGIRKETASAAAGAMEYVRCCRNCMHSKPLHGSGHIALMCSNQPGRQGQWYLIGERDTCAQFTPATPSSPRGGAAGARMIPLSQGKYALVDQSDYAALARHRWCATKSASWYNKTGKSDNRKTFYAVRTENGRGIRMHRRIMGAKPGQVVDHINHNGLDNRRCNLRLCSQAKNALNRRGQRGRSSRYKGVSYHRHSAKWQAGITYEGKYHFLGQFDSETAAARAYNKKARRLCGEFACLNDV